MKPQACILAFFLLLSATACSQSPILNHDHANETPSEPRRPRTGFGTCALQFENSELCGALTWMHGPVTREYSSFKLNLHNIATGKGQDVADLEVELWMPSMGHGSSPVTISRALDSNGEVEPGAYIVENVYFSMGGNWDIHIRFSTGDKLVVEGKYGLKL